MLPKSTMLNATVHKGSVRAALPSMLATPVSRREHSRRAARQVGGLNRAPRSAAQEEAVQTTQKPAFDIKVSR